MESGGEEWRVREENDEEREIEKEEIRRVMGSLKEGKAAKVMGYGGGMKIQGSRGMDVGAV